MIKIKKNPNGDTRTAPKGITFEQFQEANDSHIADVRVVMNKIAVMLLENGINHDHTKKSAEEQFYKDFISTINEGTNFVSGIWYQYHINAERHHLLSRCPKDVNLLDVIEMIVDCVCAGLSRSGEIRDLEINSEILDMAVKNTSKMIQDMVRVIE